MCSGLLLLLLCSFLGCGTQCVGSAIMDNSILTFNMKLFKAILEEKQGNVVISPTSVYASLSMLHQGARGFTNLQLNSVLKTTAYHTRHRFREIIASIRNVRDSPLEFANSMFIQNGFSVLPSYQNILQTGFFSDVQTVDFNKPIDAVNDINSWVANHTHNRITQLITPEHITPDYKLLLTSAVYFKDEWKLPFMKNITHDETFSSSPGKSVNVSTMCNVAQYVAGENHVLGYKWLQLPFKDNRFSLLIVLPNEKYGLNDLLRKFPSKTTDHLLRLGHIMEVSVCLPKFKLSSEVETITALKKMGLKNVFSKEYSDLKGISKYSLYVSDLLHKAELQIDEEGATASAVTGISIVATSASPTSFEFHADHPFAVFVMDHQNNIPLFSARIVDPSIL